MKQLKNLVVLLVVAIGVASCNTHKKDDLYGVWRIVRYQCIANSSPIGLSRVANGSDYSLEFDNQGMVICNTGCNLVSGQYIVEGDKLTFPEITSTEMACEDMIVEESLKRSLPCIRSYEVRTDSLLLLKDMDGHVLIELQKLR